MGTFIRGLWGATEQLQRESVYRDIRRMAEQPTLHPGDTVSYVFGTENAEFLKSLGIEVTCLDPSPIKNYGYRTPVALSGHNNDLVHGMRMYVHKLDCILQGVKAFGSVVFLDWDCTLLQPLPADFWQRMEQGQSLQAGMRRLKRNRYWWRHGGASEMPHGCWIYCRSLPAIQQLMTLQFWSPMAYEEELLGIWAELQLGPWDATSADRWLNEGYQPYCLDYRCRPWPAEIGVFRHV